ncbi:uncharacterized protein TNCV_1476821 [Trichonephila clavipes]|nr:uncharacterized protein TNCV_1476821 [Trichonephila clavipes]
MDILYSDRVAAVVEWNRYRIVACLVTSSSPVPLKTRRCVCPRDLALLSSLGLRDVPDRGRLHSKGGDQRKKFLPSANNFMVTHPRQTITDKNISNMTLLLLKTTDHVFVGDETENNIVNPQTLVAEYQHINPPEPECMATADSDTPKKPLSVLDLKPLPKTTQYTDNCVEVLLKSPAIGVVGRRGGASSGVLLVTRSRYKIERTIANSPRVTME